METFFALLAVLVRGIHLVGGSGIGLVAPTLGYEQLVNVIDISTFVLSVAQYIKLGGLKSQYSRLIGYIP